MQREPVMLFKTVESQQPGRLSGRGKVVPAKTVFPDYNSSPEAGKPEP